MATNWKVHALILTAAACLAATVYSLYTQESRDSVKCSVENTKTGHESQNTEKNADPIRKSTESKPTHSLNVCQNNNALALSSVCKMTSKRRKIPRGATGAMPTASTPNTAKSKGPIIGFRQKQVENPSNIESAG